ncbi:MAG: FlgD immunoglobulin-like domain containing protein [Candidatus Cloacimonas sp.]
MRKLFIFATMLMSVCLSAQSWKTYTNTNHIYDLILKGNDLYCATWGGVLKLNSINDSEDLSSYSETNVYNKGNGLVSNDIRTLTYIDFSESLWMGSSDNGISILSQLGFQDIGSDLGLPSLKVTRIIEHESTILVATSEGLAVFYYLPSVSFPLMLHQYTSATTSGGMVGNNIVDMLLADTGTLFLATTNGVSYVPLDSLDIDSAWKTIQGVGNPVLSGGNPILSANSDDLAIGFYDKVYVHSLDMNGGSWLNYNVGNMLTGKDVSSVLLDSQSRLWVAYASWKEATSSYTNTTDSLFTLIENNTYAHILKETNGLGYSPISRILEINGKIYLCSWGEGFFRQEDDTWINYDPACIGFPRIGQVVTDNNYNLWFASGYMSNLPVKKGSMGVSKFADGDWKTLNIHNSPIHTDNVLGIAVDHLNRKWFATWDNSSSPQGWEKGISIYDEDNNSWVHISDEGIRHYDNVSETWSIYDTSTRLSTGTIGGIYPASDSLMMVMCYIGGVDILNMNFEKVAHFSPANTLYNSVLYGYYNGQQYFIGTNNDRGLTIWNNDSLPVTGGDYWVIPSPPNLNNCVVYGVVTVETPYEGKQHWIAASTGVFMWNETDWYRYDTMIKRYKYSPISHQWENDILYYVDEERLFGSVRTTPTCIYLDAQNRIWLGSMENGLSVYDPYTERFTNYFYPNYPLISNYITSLGFDPVAGNLIIGTPDGFNTLRISRTVKPLTTLQNLKAFPNPFRPSIHPYLQIVNMPVDNMPPGKADCRIYDASGALVMKLKENAFSRFQWDGKNANGKQCASGIYFFVVADDAGNVKKGKLAIIND